VLPALIDQVALAVQNAYNINPNFGNVAQGVQLDVIGKYVGAFRSANTINGFVTLDDSDFLKLINLAIIRNSAGSSLGDIDSALTAYFTGDIKVSDTADMSLVYTIVNTFGSSALQNVIIGNINSYEVDGVPYNGYLPKPMGVQISATIVPPGPQNYFAYATYTEPIGPGFTGFNSYQFLNPNSRWATYAI
jgi:hypothetical protein